MERLIAAARASSSAGAVLSLVVANLVPIVGVLAWGWNVWTILTLYWIENGIVGLYNIAKILRSEGVPALARSRIGAVGRTGVAAAFVVHYGLFWAVHGIFVLVALPGFSTGMDGLTGLVVPGPIDAARAGDASTAQPDQVVVGAIGLAISHGVSFWTVYLGRAEYRRTSPQAQAQAPYGRLVILHVTIIFGAMLSLLIGAPIGALLVLVGVKLALDLRFHLREHAGIPTQRDESIFRER